MLRDIQSPDILVQLLLDIKTNRTSAVIQNCELGLMVEQPGQVYPLFLTARQNVVPVLNC
jgi:hypothetical protein